MSELLPESTGDEADEGWGEPAPDRGDDDERLAAERPPHHDAGW